MELEQQIKEYDSLIDLLEDLDREGIQGRERLEIYKRYMGFRARMKEIPYSGGFELTPLCNFDCKMCYVHLTKGQMQKEGHLLSVEQWVDIMRQACDLGMAHADLTGGECLAYPGFKEVYRYLMSRGVQVSVLTNGSLLTEDIASFFGKYKPEIVQVSIYGSNNDAYERVTGKRAFDEVMAGIQRLKNHGIRVKVSIMPHRYMKEDRFRLIDLVDSLGIDYAIGGINLPARSNTGRELEEYAAEAEVYADLIRAEYKLRERHMTGDVMTMPRTLYIPSGMNADEGIPCASGRSSFHVNWKGDLTPCIPYNEICVSVLNHVFSEAWAEIKRIMSAYRTPTQCETCDMKDRCVTCPAEKTFGILNGPLNTLVCDRLRNYLRIFNE